MNVLFVVHTPKDPQTAVFKVMSEQADALRGLGHNVEILAPEDFSISRWVGSRFDPLLFPVLVCIRLMRTGRTFDLIKFHSYCGWLFVLLRRVFHLWRKARTVTEFHGLEPVYVAALQKEAQRSGQRLTWRYRLVNNWFTNIMLGVACRCSDLVLCLNNKEVSVLKSNGWFSGGNVAVYRNGVASEFFEVHREFKQLAATLLFVGQWNPMKGTPFLVEAFAQLAEQNEIRLVCAGTLRDEKTVLDDFPIHVRRIVTVRPRVTRDELIQLHSMADIFVFPTLSEGASLALLEAMASGLPIVTTPVGLAPDILHDHASALLVPLADATALSLAIQELLNDRELRAHLGRNARLAALQYRSATALAHNISQLEGLVHNGFCPQFADESISAAPVRN